MSADTASLLDEALAIVRSAGDIIAEHNKKPRSIRHKGRIDLVTDTDLAVEGFLKRELAALYPGSSFMAEESYSGSGLTPSGDGPLWIIDPVDGTTNFAHGLPFVASSVALWSKGRVEMGIVNAPLLGECFWAARGMGAFCNGRPIKVSGQTNIEEALVATGFPYTIAEAADEITDILRRVLKSAQGVRRYGAAAIDLVYLAAGRYDAFYENGLKAWDVAAGMLIIEEAGGTVSRYDGKPLIPGEDGIMASASVKLHCKMRALVTI